METLMSTLKERDSPLWFKLQEQDLKPQFYAFRWLTLMLSQEFPLPGTYTEGLPLAHTHVVTGIPSARYVY